LLDVARKSDCWRDTIGRRAVFEMINEGGYAMNTRHSAVSHGINFTEIWSDAIVVGIRKRGVKLTSAAVGHSP
jgi:hypothetical protein